MVSKMPTEITTIQISRKLRQMLAGIGAKGDTYESILWRLLKQQGQQLNSVSGS
jgi:hypothetical protein